MNNVNKTLYIPLYGKAYVSRKGIILHDTKAEEIWAAESFPLKGKSKSKWLAYFMGMRSAVYDRWLEEKMCTVPDAVVLHIGCGMDSRAERVGTHAQAWYDIDFPEVIHERKRYYQESEDYHMIPSDIRDLQWLDALPKGAAAIVVMEGVSMYLHPKELRAVLQAMTAYFDRLHILMDCYTEFAARASRYKNPINDVGVSLVYGLDDPRKMADGTGILFLKEHEMTPDPLINQLQGIEQAIFKKVYAGTLAKKLYRMYEYCAEGDHHGGDTANTATSQHQ